MRAQFSQREQISIINILINFEKIINYQND